MLELKSRCLVCKAKHSVFGTCPDQAMPSWVPPPDVVTPTSRFDPRKLIHADLLKFLEALWRRRASIRSSNTIYGEYNALSQGNKSPLSPGDGGAYFRYVDALYKIYMENDVTVSVQNYTRWELGHLIAVAKGEVRPFPADILANVREWRGDPDLTAGEGQTLFTNDFVADFFHFLKYKRPGCTQRVYLNVNGDTALKVFGFVVNAVVAGLPNVDEAKIAGPRGVGERADSIVIYSKTEVTTNAIIERVTEYQRLGKNRDYFGDKTPYMTDPVPRLRGVAVGAEPNVGQIELPHRVEFGLGRESFGSMRAKLIYNALDANRSDQMGFYRAVVRNFAAAKVSPLAPHI